MSRHRHSNRDLPVIFEASSPKDEDVMGDEASFASFAFSLGNVGMDEESGSILHSPTQSLASSPISIVSHSTPPSSMSCVAGGSRRESSPSRTYSENDLHRETCRQLGIPLNDDNTVSSSRESADADTSSLSEDAKSPARESWPWPEVGSTTTADEGDMYDVPLGSNNHRPLVPSSSNSGKNKNSAAMATGVTQEQLQLKKGTLFAKVAGTAAVYSNMMKEAAASWSEKSHILVQNARQDRIVVGASSPGESSAPTTPALPSQTKPRLDVQELYPLWLKKANPLYKLTIGTTILFMILCIIVIVAVAGTSSSRKSRLEGDGAIVIVGNPGAISGSNDNSAIVATDANQANDPSGDLSETTPPTYAPTHSPFDLPIQSNGKGNNSCADEKGKFRTHRGKKRECHWMTIHNAGILQSQRQDDQCGANGEMPSELGEHCGYTCRAYNGCIKAANNDQEEEEVEKVQPVPEMSTFTQTGNPTSLPTQLPTLLSSLIPTKYPTEAPLTKPTNIPTELPSNSPTNRPTNKSTMIQLGVVELSTFIDTKGRERPCTWLDIRNWSQRKVRREDNCQDISVQQMCPSSCQDYITEDEGKGEVIAKLSPFVEVDVDTSADNSTDASTDTMTFNSLQLLRRYDPVPQDECSNINGYYLNDQNEPKQCSWLEFNDNDAFSSQDRKAKNCGTSLEYPHPTDLGRMCKHTCGTCEN